MTLHRLLAASIASATAGLVLLCLPAGAQGYICAEGGGNASNGSWAPAVFGWMLEKAPAAHVVVLGITGGDTNAQNASSRLERRRRWGWR
ncbi:MAG: hypothetical protein H0V12_04500 [Chloroflexi bacterium]|nr:hypothetical protein [Chloroflexota bacterium]